MKKLACLALLLSLSVALAQTNGVKSLTVLPTTDTSELGLKDALQNAAGQLYQSTESFQVQLSSYSLPGFTANEIQHTFQTVQTDLISFVYMERPRISIFLFDRTRPNEFIVSFRILNDAPGGQLTSTFIEGRFREAVGEVLEAYIQGRFQPLPGTGENAQSNEESQRKANEARKLFRELAALESKTWYVSANIGMARFAANNNSASTVNFGGYGGAYLSERISAELGLDLFSYSLLHADLRYALPFAEKYVNLSGVLGVARFMGTLTENRGFNSRNIAAGSTVFGPGIGFDVPLLGATLRGDIRFYLGSATVLLGTYGIVYNL